MPLWIGKMSFSQTVNKLEELGFMEGNRTPEHRRLVNQLLAGGYFSQADGKAANNIAIWDGTVWNPIGDGFNNWIPTLASYNDTFVAGGDFNKSGNREVSFISIYEEPEE